MFALPIPVSEIEFVTNFLPICRRDKVFFFMASSLVFVAHGCYL